MKYRRGWTSFSNNYYAIHSWLQKEHGKANHCENKSCVNEKATRFHYALKHGKSYERHRMNFMQLCTSCHKKYDMKPSTRRKNSISMLGKRNQLAAVWQYSKEGKKLRKFDAIIDVKRKLGISDTSISNVLNGRALSAGGYIWKYA